MKLTSIAMGSIALLATVAVSAPVAEPLPVPMFDKKPFSSLKRGDDPDKDKKRDDKKQAKADKATAKVEAKAVKTREKAMKKAGGPESQPHFGKGGAISGLAAATLRPLTKQELQGGSGAGSRKSSSSSSFPSLPGSMKRAMTDFVPHGQREGAAGPSNRRESGSSVGSPSSSLRRAMTAPSRSGSVSSTGAVVGKSRR